MSKENRSILACIIIAAFVAAAGLFPSAVMAGQLEPPSSAVDGSGNPVPTMKTLDQIPPAWSQKLPADKRFELVLDGAAVLDKETGLVWARYPGTEYLYWEDAMNYCWNLTIGGRKGWRLPSIEELASLVDPALVDPTTMKPALPDGHPFVNVPSSSWCSTKRGPGEAYWIDIRSGQVDVAGTSDFENMQRAWAVRCGVK